MGLFSMGKKQREINKQAEWKYGINNALVKVDSTYMTITTAAVEEVIFYQDIMNVEVVTNIVNIRTNVKTFSLISRSFRGGNEKAFELRNLILAKMAENK